MLTIPESTVAGIAADARAVLQKTDQALLAQTQLVASLLEGADGVDLPIAMTQQLYVTAHAHGTRLLEGRGELSRLVSRLTAVKDVSDQRELAIGCPRPLPEPGEAVTPDFFTGASLDRDHRSD
jgi:hypothetical protein